MKIRNAAPRLASLLAGLLGFVFMLIATGCASRPYPKPGAGEGSAAGLYFVPLILANEMALYVIEKDRERDKDKAAEAVLDEKLSRKRRFDELQRLVSSGDAAMQHELAFCYQHGRGAIRDTARAAFWYEKSAIQGFAEAQNALGLCYFNEIGVGWDKVEACAWWSLAAPFHERAKASLAFVELDEGSRMTQPAFADFKASVGLRAEALKVLVGSRAIAREAHSTCVQAEGDQAR